MRIIVCLSGGKASAFVANLILKKYPPENVILYFNDTKWEHEDLYRFLNELSIYFNKEILVDSDGRTPEDLFYDKGMLANNRVPFCSGILKAERLQKFYRHNDVLVFGITYKERNRAERIKKVYQQVMIKSKKRVYIQFPLIKNRTTNSEVDNFLKSIKIKEPLLYRLGFTHNNCSGGCVRAGKKQWIHLYKTLPEVFKDRERIEREFSEYIGKTVSFMKNKTLTELRKEIDTKKIINLFDSSTDNTEIEECLGYCEGIGLHD